MTALKTLENKLAAVFKDLPQLSNNNKESLAKAWPWIALVFGVLQLLAAWTLYRLATAADRLYDLANSLSTYYGGTSVGPTSTDKTIIYAGVLLLAVDAVILLAAFPKLRERAKSGWDLLLLGALLNLAYGVVQIFTYDRGVGSFVISLIGSALGFYLLFQVREKFGGRKTTHSTHAVGK